MVETKANELLIIDSLINEHTAITGHMHSVCSLLDSWDEDIPAHGIPAAQEQSLSQKGLNLKQTMAYLDDGLKQHHKHEEEVMPAIIGDLVMEALKTEHKEIIKQLGEINFVLRDINPGALAANFDYLKLIINNLCNLVSLHSSVENTLLTLMKRRFI
jgi:hypothetical protein